VRFWSAKEFFGRAVTRQRPAVRTIFFNGGSECLERPNAPERRWQRVAIAACEERKEISPPGDEGHKKTRFRGLCSGLVYLPITGGVFAVQRIRFRSGVPNGSRVGRCARITVRVACRLLCQLFYHVECVEHQLCHVDSARANPHHRGNNLLLDGRHAFAYLANLFNQVFTRCDCLAPGYVRFIIAADTRTRLFTVWL